MACAKSRPCAVARLARPDLARVDASDDFVAGRWRICASAPIPSVRPGSDEIVLRPEDLDFPVTTESAGLARFLAAQLRRGKARLLHLPVGARRRRGHEAGSRSTSPSSTKRTRPPGLIEGVSSALPSRTNISRSGSGYSSPRPRAITISASATKEGDARLVYSMDAPEIYGPVAHNLVSPKPPAAALSAATRSSSPL